jgi:hypothetical protein
MALDVTEFQNPSGIRWNGDVGIVEYGTNNMVVIFYSKGLHNPAKSNDAGRPVYEDKIFVRIHPPGERLNIVDRPATDVDKRRYPTQWRQFVDNHEQVADGTPIDLLWPNHPAVAATLRAHGVQTIEQCAALSGVAIDQIGMGCQRWVNDATKYIEVSNKGINASQLRHELDERDGRIRVLTQQVDMLKAEVERLSAMGNSDQVQQMQQLIMSMAQRPQYMSSPSIVPGIDIEQARINANHPTQELARRRGRPPGAKNKPRV